jgi:hypothetical protein
MSSATSSSYLIRLMAIARESRVQVHFIAGQMFADLDWDGLYLVTPELGAGIAVRSDLDSAWRDWVLGHELGHHFGKLNGTLFSPFRAHLVDRRSRTRWGESRRLDRDEENANEWAAKTLISDHAWDEAEKHNPTNLAGIVERLGLPFPAGAAWERWHRDHAHGEPVDVRLGAEAIDTLSRPITGRGGHQSYFARLKRSKETLTVSYRDLSLARERAAFVEGGWLARYRAVLDAMRPAIHAAGTTRALFRLRHS